MEKLTDIALQALHIDKDIIFRFEHKDTIIEDFDLYTFEQVWGSTCGAFSGVGGCAMTSQRTWVFVPVECDEKCFVYFSGRFGYAVPYSQKFKEDLLNHQMASVTGSVKYLRSYKNENT